MIVVIMKRHWLCWLIAHLICIHLGTLIASGGDREQMGGELYRIRSQHFAPSGNGGQVDEYFRGTNRTLISCWFVWNGKTNLSHMIMIGGRTVIAYLDEVARGRPDLLLVLDSTKGTVSEAYNTMTNGVVVPVSDDRLAKIRDEWQSVPITWRQFTNEVPRADRHQRDVVTPEKRSQDTIPPSR